MMSTSSSSSSSSSSAGLIHPDEYSHPITSPVKVIAQNTLFEQSDVLTAARDELPASSSPNAHHSQAVTLQNKLSVLDRTNEDSLMSIPSSSSASTPVQLHSSQQLQTYPMHPYYLAPSEPTDTQTQKTNTLQAKRSTADTKTPLSGTSHLSSQSHSNSLYSAPEQQQQQQQPATQMLTSNPHVQPEQINSHDVSKGSNETHPSSSIILPAHPSILPSYHGIYPPAQNQTVGQSPTQQLDDNDEPDDIDIDRMIEDKNLKGLTNIFHGPLQPFMVKYLFVAVLLDFSWTVYAVTRLSVDSSNGIKALQDRTRWYGWVSFLLYFGYYICYDLLVGKRLAKVLAEEKEEREKSLRRGEKNPLLPPRAAHPMQHKPADSNNSGHIEKQHEEGGQAGSNGGSHEKVTHITHHKVADSSSPPFNQPNPITIHKVEQTRPPAPFRSPKMDVVIAQVEYEDTDGIETDTTLEKIAKILHVDGEVQDTAAAAAQQPLPSPTHSKQTGKTRLLFKGPTPWSLTGVNGRRIKKQVTAFGILSLIVIGTASLNYDEVLHWYITGIIFNPIIVACTSFFLYIYDRIIYVSYSLVSNLTFDPGHTQYRVKDVKRVCRLTARFQRILLKQTAIFINVVFGALFFVTIFTIMGLLATDRVFVIWKLTILIILSLCICLLAYQIIFVNDIIIKFQKDAFYAVQGNPHEIFGLVRFVEIGDLFVTVFGVVLTRRVIVGYALTILATIIGSFSQEILQACKSGWF